MGVCALCDTGHPPRPSRVLQLYSAQTVSSGCLPTAAYGERTRLPGPRTLQQPKQPPLSSGALSPWIGSLKTMSTSEWRVRQFRRGSDRVLRELAPIHAGRCTERSGHTCMSCVQAVSLNLLLSPGTVCWRWMLEGFRTLRGSTLPGTLVGVT